MFNILWDVATGRILLIIKILVGNRYVLKEVAEAEVAEVYLVSFQY
jgi:hypothetical protein